MTTLRAHLGPPSSVAALGVVFALVALAGCAGAETTEPPVATSSPAAVATATATTGSTTSPVAPPTTAPTPTKPSAAPPVTGGATPAPTWLGRRVLKRGADGFGRAPAGGTPAELRDRRIVTVDLLTPPPDGRFHSSITTVPTSVATRSTWTSGCPVALDDLRYVTVSFRGFDGRAHTGELLVNRSVARDVVTVFGSLFTEGFPIEQMRITSLADLDAPPTGDGNDTSAFACRAVRGATSWSQHAYGLAIDVNPFQNPYVDGDTVLPELAIAYTDRRRGLPGMITPGSKPARAFAAIGWGWGGRYTSKKDWMHFSSTGK